MKSSRKAGAQGIGSGQRTTISQADRHRQKPPELFPMLRKARDAVVQTETLLTDQSQARFQHRVEVRHFVLTHLLPSVRPAPRALDAE